MRLVYTILVVLSAKLSLAQGWSADFAEVDWKAQSVAAVTPDSLALQLTAPYKTDLQKVRAIFRWIAENISYRVKSNYKPVSDADEPILLDTANSLHLFNEQEAKRVLKRKVAVCDGYARLFKTLCDYAGIRSEIISGFARSGQGRISKNFKSNHSWNAVFVDSTWHLLDVTWASGYTDYSGYEFIRHFDEYYFLTPPRQFVQDHFPEDLQWTLLTKPPVLREFYNTPFKPGAFIRHRIRSFLPSKGIIEAAVGDTVLFEVEADDAAKSFEISEVLFPDSTLSLNTPFDSTGLKSILGNNRVKGLYIVRSDAVEWLDIRFNGDIIMRYKINVKNEKGIKPEPPLLKTIFPFRLPLQDTTKSN